MYGTTYRVKTLFDGAKSIEDMISRARDFTGQLEQMRQAGVKLEREVNYDNPFLVTDNSDVAKQLGMFKIAGEEEEPNQDEPQAPTISKDRSDDEISAELFLPLFKQGDDLANWIAKAKSPAGGMRLYASALRGSAEQLEEIAKAIEGQNVTVDADTHHIGLSGPGSVLKPLIRNELLEEDDWAEEEEEEAGE